MKKKIIILALIIFSMCTVVYAHSGRTDSNGGHYDRSTGEYHYHTGEYAGKSSSSSSKSTSTSEKLNINKPLENTTNKSTTLTIKETKEAKEQEESSIKGNIILYIMAAFIVLPWLMLIIEFILEKMRNHFKKENK